MQKLVEPAVPDRVIKGFEDRYHRTFDLAPFDGEWGNTHRYKHDGIQQRWEGWRDGYLAVISPALTAHPKIVELVARLTEYAKDWRDRAADASIVEEAATALTALAALSPLPAPEPTEGIAELRSAIRDEVRRFEFGSAVAEYLADAILKLPALTALQAERNEARADAARWQENWDANVQEMSEKFRAVNLAKVMAGTNTDLLDRALAAEADLAAMKEGAAVAIKNAFLSGFNAGESAGRFDDDTADEAWGRYAFAEATVITHPAPADKGVVECASEDCGQPATRYYAKFGVGSHHCEVCYQRIVALAAASPPAEGDER
jgi:hypothetical protein